MTISDARSLSASRYPVQKFGLEYDGPPSPQQMNEDALFYVHDETSGVLLMFNHFGKLIEKKRTKWFGVNITKSIDALRTGR